MNIKNLMSLDVWRIYLRKHYDGDILDSREGFVSFLQDRDVTYADPFLFAHAGRTYLFYEKQNLWSMKGILCCRCLEQPDEEIPVLEKNHHLSYPNVFELNGEIVMVPETRNAQCLEMYRFTDFPRGLEKINELLPLAAVDTTFAETGENNGVMFTYTDHSLVLYPYHTDGASMTIGDAGCRLSDDEASLRPAGHVFFHGQRPIRPAQYGKDFYGQGLVFYEIQKLSANDYREDKVGTVLGTEFLPGDQACVGIHTYNRCGAYEVVDLKFRRRGLGTMIENVLLRLAWKRDRWKR